MATRKNIEFAMRKKFFADTFIDPKNTVIQEKSIAPNAQPITPKRKKCNMKLITALF